MPAPTLGSSVLNKTDVAFEDYAITRRDGAFFATVDYVVETAEGEVIHRTATEELKGDAEAKAQSLLADVRSFVRAKEGLS